MTGKWQLGHAFWPFKTTRIPHKLIVRVHDMDAVCFGAWVSPEVAHRVIQLRRGGWSLAGMADIDQTAHSLISDFPNLA